MRLLPKSPRADRWIRIARYGFAVTGVLALGYCLAVYLEARSFQATAARDFDRELRSAAARAVRPSSFTIPDSVPRHGVIGRLEIPRIGVAVMVIEGADAHDLERAAGHIPGTALPGEAGNVVIAGHRDTFFRPLRDIRRNDTIDLVTLRAANRYRVVSTKVVPPEDVDVLRSTRRDVLTLVTCFPFDYVGPAPERFVVRAERLP